MQKFITKLFEQKNESESTKLEKITRKTNVHHDTPLQDVITKLIELKNENESHKMESFMKTKNVSRNNQLHEFIMQIVELKNDSDPSPVRRYFPKKIKESFQLRYVDKAEQNIKQHLHVTYLEDGEGITRYYSKVNVNNDISNLYNCKDATTTEHKTTSLAT